MMAEAFRAHGGIIMWRAFVYDFADQNVNEDRVKRAYLVFKPLDGQFADNVLVQAKNGPLDFQPREPFHPSIWRPCQKPACSAELQCNQEYSRTGRRIWSTWAPCGKSFCARTPSELSVSPKSSQQGPKPGTGGFTATSNVGDDRNWTGHDFAQANWYAYGRLGLGSEALSASHYRPGVDKIDMVTAIRLSLSPSIKS